MMNARVLELIKNPELIQNEDLKLLDSEIKNYPYVQNIRALRLFGIHKFNPENYQTELSTTAAFTTDKKNLYHFINKKSVQIIEEQQPATNCFVVDEIIETEKKKKPNPVYINGELNRILYEGEEDFLEKETEKIDIEATKESGVIITESVKEPEFSEPVTAEVEEVFEDTEEVIIEEKPAEKIAVESLGEEEKSAEVNFHGTQEFMPNIAVPKQPVKTENYQLKQNVNRHEDEMKRLIAEVEAKLKAKKQARTEAPKPVEEDPSTGELSFADIPSFDVKPPEEKPVEIEAQVEEVKEPISEKTEVVTEAKEMVETPAENRFWKPMSVTSGTMDSALSKKVEPVSEEKVSSTEEKPIVETKPEDRPVFNVSFFSDQVEKIEPEEDKKESEPDQKTTESNVPKFINTWQSWLKLDKKPVEKPEVSEDEVKEEIKEKAIEKFIETEPKISKLKEESSFVVKEKTDDISHLMTETLAKLYVEQRLYAKAIKAYETLQKKHPEKTEEFAEKIEEIKQLRTNK